MDYSNSGLLLSRSRRHDASISIHDSAELQFSTLAYKSVMDPFEMVVIVTVHNSLSLKVSRLVHCIFNKESTKLHRFLIC